MMVFEMVFGVLLVLHDLLERDPQQIFHAVVVHFDVVHIDVAVGAAMTLHSYWTEPLVPHQLLWL